MAVSRSTIDRSAAAIEWNSVTLYPETEIAFDHAPDWDDIVSWAYGRVDEALKDRVWTIKARLWGAYENLSVLFPSGAMTPVPGTSLCSDATLGIIAKNTDKVVFQNAALTKLIDLYVGVDKNVFAADVEFMAIIKSGKNPEDDDAYFVRSSAAFSASVAFAKTNFLRRRAACVWGSKTGFTSFEFREGIKVGWKYDVQKDYSANYGTDNLYIGPKGLIAELSGIPAMTGANLVNSDNQLLGTLVSRNALGILASTNSADLVATLAGTGSHAITVKNAFLAKFSECFDIKKLRPGEHLWRSTTGITAGAIQATAVVA